MVSYQNHRANMAKVHEVDTILQKTAMQACLDFVKDGDVFDSLVVQFHNLHRDGASDDNAIFHDLIPAEFILGIP